MSQADHNLNTAINAAIDACIENSILKDVLITQRAEVLQVLLTTFNKELYEQGLKDDAYSAGEHQGILKGKNEKLIEQIQKKLAKGKSIETIADELEETQETIKNMIALFIDEK